MANRTCLVCGNQYDYCNKCKQYASEPRWKATYCSNNCREIYSIVNKYAFGHILVEEAKKSLANLDTNNVINNEIKQVINDLNLIEIEQPKTIEIEEPIIVETSTVIEEEKPKKTSKRKNVSKEDEIVNVD